MPCWFGPPIPWFSAGEYASETSIPAQCRRRGHEIVHPALAVSAAKVALTEGCLDAVDQRRRGIWLGQETNGSGPQRAGADAVFGKCGDKDKRRVVAPGTHMGQQVQPAHARHLHIRNDARRRVQVGRSQELLGRRKCLDRVAKRTEKIVGRGPNGSIVVNNRNYRKHRRDDLPELGARRLP